MVKKILSLVIFMLGLSIGLFFIATPFHKNFLEYTPSIIDTNDSIIKVDAINKQAISTKSDVSEKTIGNVSEAIQDITDQSLSSSAIDVVQELNAKAVANLSPGWIHVRAEIHYDTDEGNNGVLPNGTAIPLNQLNDEWYHLSKDLLVYEMISIMKTMDGEIVQVGVGKNGVVWNSATKETVAGEFEKINGFDMNFLNDLKNMQDFGIQPQLSRVSLPDGRAGIQIVTSEKYESPIKSVDYEMLLTKAETRNLFDEENGYLLEKTVVFTFEDGSERTFLKLSQEISEEDPPKDILIFLTDSSSLEVSE